MNLFALDFKEKVTQMVNHGTNWYILIQKKKYHQQIIIIIEERRMKQNNILKKIKIHKMENQKSRT